MASQFAADTKVPASRSRAEIEQLLTRYGATRFASGWDDLGASIMFDAHGRRVRFHLPIPSPSDPRFEKDGRGHRRTPVERKGAQEQEERRLWRALALVIKAKLEAVQSGIVSFESEFAVHIVLPGRGGTTVGEWLLPQIAEAYDKGVTLPPLLGAGT